jgi:phosphate transport system ATP-binding protein
MVENALNTVIRVTDLNLWFGANHVLKKVSMPFESCRVTAIMGPSGCGKSTFIRCFNRMNDLIPSCRIEGKVTIDGRDIYAPQTDIYSLRTRVGMVFQKPNPFPKSIFDNVVYGPVLKGGFNRAQLVEKAEKSLRDAWLWDEVKDRLHVSAMELSGGQQQRLCIARALANDPEVLLMDEPTSALDPQSTNRIEELLADLKKSVTIAIVTHNIGQAGRISDFTAFFYLGELVEFGPTEGVFTVPKDKRTEAYLTGKFG